MNPWTSPLTIEPRQEVVDQIHAEVFAERIAKRSQQTSAVVSSSTTAGLCLSDEEILQRALRAKNGDKFKRLYYLGDISDYRRGDNEGRSEAEQGLCNHLAFWCGNDPERIARLMRSSALARSKLYRDSYLERTIANALATARDTYSGGQHMGNGANAAGNASTNNGAHQEQETTAEDLWIDPLEDDAFHGPAGEFANAVAPYYEGEKVTLLIHFLLVFGNLVGRNAYYLVGRTRHYLNLFVCDRGSDCVVSEGLRFRLGIRFL